MKDEVSELLKGIIDSVQYTPNVFSAWYSEDRIIIGAYVQDDPAAQDFFSYATIYNTILDLDTKIKFSVDKALELAEDTNFDNWKPLQTPSENEYMAIYYVENAVFRISALWDMLAQLFNIYADIRRPLNEVYAKQLFHDAQQGKRANPFAKRVYSYMEQSDGPNSEWWEGNYVYTKDLRDKLTHKASPNVSSLSSFATELRMPALYTLSRAVEDYKQVSDFIEELLVEILAKYKKLAGFKPDVKETTHA